MAARSAPVEPTTPTAASAKSGRSAPSALIASLLAVETVADCLNENQPAPIAPMKAGTEAATSDLRRTNARRRANAREETIAMVEMSTAERAKRNSKAAPDGREAMHQAKSSRSRSPARPCA